MTAVAESSEDTLLCPLCEYDLRGQVEPRCPECGYRFDWDELRDPSRRLHPYLFEHHPERNLWSLLRTLRGGLRPRKFWRELFPTQPSRPRRLVLYWLIITAVALIPFVVILVLGVVQLNDYNGVVRQRVASGTALSPRDVADIISQHGSVTAYLDRFFPLFPNPRLLWLSWQSPYTARQLLTAMVFVAWPWLTFAALMVFQVSMRRAKVRTIHVLRCVLYSADLSIWPALILIALIVYTQWAAMTLPMPQARATMRYVYEAPLLIAVGLMVLLTHRLWMAYRLYLRFDHALATVVASQMMVALALWKLGLDTGMIGW